MWTWDCFLNCESLVSPLHSEVDTGSLSVCVSVSTSVKEEAEAWITSMAVMTRDLFRVDSPQGLPSCP